MNFSFFVPDIIWPLLGVFMRVWRSPWNSNWSNKLRACKHRATNTNHFVYSQAKQAQMGIFSLPIHHMEHRISQIFISVTWPFLDCWIHACQCTRYGFVRLHPAQFIHAFCFWRLLGAICSPSQFDTICHFPGFSSSQSNDTAMIGFKRIQFSSHLIWVENYCKGSILSSQTGSRF